MDRFLLPLLGALLGAAGGVFAARALSPDPSVAPTSEARGSDDLHAQVAEIRRLLDRPTLATAPATPGGPATAAASGEIKAESHAVSPEMVALLAGKLAEEMERRRADGEKAQAKAQADRQRRVSLAEAARELELTSAQETEVRLAHEAAVEKLLKLFAEPESDAETLRRELLAAKGDPAKKRALVTKQMPKLMTKLGDVMAIEAERQARISEAVGPEKAGKLEDYNLEEEDPFELGTNVSVGVRSGN
jgi:hypothetical protein